jgi:type 1 glutamine amidotransferase
MSILMLRVVLSGCLALIVATTVLADPPKKLLLVGQGPDGHPKQSHEYMAGVKILELCLKPMMDIEVTTVRADGPWKDGPELIGRSDAVVFYVSEGAKWLQTDPKRLEAVQQLAKRGGGLIVLHWGMGCKEAQYIESFVALFGGCHGGPDRKFREAEMNLSPTAVKHPILTGVGPVKVKEEFYYQLKFTKEKGLQQLMEVDVGGKLEPVCWSWERPDGGRSFGFSGLHFHANWQKAEYRRLVSHGVLWALKMPIPAKGLPVEVSDANLQLKCGGNDQ